MKIQTWTVKRATGPLDQTRIFDHLGREIEGVKSIRYEENPGALPRLYLELIVKLQDEKLIDRRKK